jgi:hypothetical protein
MAIFGWDALKKAEAYTRAADQQRLAEPAMHMLETPEQNSTESSHRGAWWDNFGKKRSKIKGQFRGWCPGEERHKRPFSIVYRVPPLPNVPLNPNQYFRDCPTYFPTLGRAAPLRLSPRVSEQRPSGHFFALRYVRRSEFRGRLWNCGNARRCRLGRKQRD